MAIYTAAELGLITRREYVKIVRDDIARETEEAITAEQAEVLIDRYNDAFAEVFAGAGAEEAFKSNPVAARYLAAIWKGEARKALRAVIVKNLGLAPEVTKAEATPVVETPAAPVEDTRTVKELRAAARDAGVKGAAKMNRTALLEALSA